MIYDISIIIPFLNEEQNIEYLASQLTKYIKTLHHIRTEVIFIDDGSTDNSLYRLKNYNHPYDVRIIKLSRNYGSHTALRAGIYHANSEYITFMYADLQDPLDLVLKLYQKCCEGYDIVWASGKIFPEVLSRTWDLFYTRN